MKRIFGILVLVALFSLTSCDDNEGFLGGHNDTNLEGLVKDHKVVEIDGCEYIVYDAYEGYMSNGFMAHKGNCKNPIHKHNK